MQELRVLAPAQSIAMVQAIITMRAVYAPVEDTLIINGPRLHGRDMFVLVALFITSVQIVVQQKQERMQQHLLITAEPDVMCVTLAPGILTARQKDNMSGTVITTFCVATVAQYKSTNGVQCTVV